MEDGGPAFPQLEGGDISAWSDDGQHVLNLESTSGMSLRDWFAGHALAGLIASNDDGAGDRIEEIPDYAYRIADAMLKARGQ